MCKMRAKSSLRCFCFLLVMGYMFCSDVFAQKSESQKAKFLDSMVKAEQLAYRHRNESLIGTRYKKANYLSDLTHIPIRELNKKIIILNFWFASCKPCLSEMRGLNNFFNTVVNNREVLFLSFTYENEETIKQIIGDNNLKYPIFSVSRDIIGEMNFNNGYPTNIILGKHFIISRIYSGAIEKDIKPNKNNIGDSLVTELFLKKVNS